MRAAPPGAPPVRDAPALLRLGRRLPPVSPELAGYALAALALSGLLWWRVSGVDSFYLDEWFYVHGSQHIWDQLPLGPLDTIPNWDRGPQRLYATLLAASWGPFSPSTAFSLSHLMNVALLVSGLVPAALFARRLIDSPLLRVLAVVLAVAVPWLMIGSHLLTENLAFPLYLWSVYAIVRCAEEPSPTRQAAALAALAALALCRLNLASMVVALFAAVLASELMRRRRETHEPLRPWIRHCVRREALVLAAGALVAVTGVVLAARGARDLGGYGVVDLDTAVDRAFGAGASETRRTFLTYTRNLVVGGFVFPFAIGLGVALAGSMGRADRRLVIPSLVALSGAVVVLGVVSVYTVGAAIEERYVFYAYAPIAVLAVAGLEQAYRLRRWIAAGSALSIWALAAGHAMPSADAGNFFAAPAGAFWSRILQHRLVGWEQDLLGWLFTRPTGWILVAAGLAAMLIFVTVARGRPKLIVVVLGCGLALCAAAQIIALDYGFKRELHGTAEVPGGIALSDDRAADRETWLDERLPAGRRAAIVPGVPSLAARWGGTERLQFWNEAIDATVVLSWNGAISPTPPGYREIATSVGGDGLARWRPRAEWLAAHRDDPRIQFPGRIVARSVVSPYALYRTAPSDRAVWTSIGLEPDGAVLDRTPVTMTLDRAAARSARAVAISLQAAEGASGVVRWVLTREGRAVATGRLGPSQSRSVRLRIPRCRGQESCTPVRWRLRARGPGVGIPVPAFGAPGPLRPVLLTVVSAQIGA